MSAPSRFGSALWGALEIPRVPVEVRRHSRVLQSPLARGVARAGIMLHYDDSTRDDGSLAWFDDPRCTNGYTWLVLRDGQVIELADPALRTPHAGACRTPFANSHFYGLAAATNGETPVTLAQLDGLAAVCEAVMVFHGWGADEVDARIVGHDREAIWTPEATRAAGLSDARGRAHWGQVGRKVDPTGTRRDARPVIDLVRLRAVVATRVRAASGGVP